jgi:hypothetical protein
MNIIKALSNLHNYSLQYSLQLCKQIEKYIILEPLPVSFKKLPAGITSRLNLSTSSYCLSYYHIHSAHFIDGEPQLLAAGITLPAGTDLAAGRKGPARASPPQHPRASPQALPPHPPQRPPPRDRPPHRPHRHPPALRLPPPLLPPQPLATKPRGGKGLSGDSGLHGPLPATEGVEQGEGSPGSAWTAEIGERPRPHAHQRADGLSELVRRSEGLDQRKPRQQPPRRQVRH